MDSLLPPYPNTHTHTHTHAHTHTHTQHTHTHTHTQWCTSEQIVDVAEFLCKLIFGDFQIFVVSGQGKCAASIGTTTSHFVFIEYPEIAKCPPDKNGVSCSRHKLVRKLAYLGVKMSSLYQKDKIITRVANINVSKLRISLKDIKSSGKLPFFV